MELCLAAVQSLPCRPGGRGRAPPPMGRARPRRSAVAALGLCAAALALALEDRGFVPPSSRLRPGRGLAARRSFDPSLTVKEAQALGVEAVPFGDGGADLEAPRPKAYTHGPCRSGSARQFVVDAAVWRTSAPGSEERQALMAEILEVLRTHGLVVLEHVMPVDLVKQLEAEAVRHLDARPDGFVAQPLRAKRSQLHLPFAPPWNSEWLVRSDLILEVVARYVVNDMAGGRTEEEQQWNWVQWVSSGVGLEWFGRLDQAPKPGGLLDSPPAGCTDVGSPQERGPWLGRVMVTKTPPQSPPQKRHRDIILPGPASQLTIQVGLTELLANNGPLGYFPGSHLMRTPGYEVVCIKH